MGELNKPEMKELIEQAREAIDSLDDFARMANVVASGPLLVLSKAIDALEQQAKQIEDEHRAFLFKCKQLEHEKNNVDNLHVQLAEMSSMFDALSDLTTGVQAENGELIAQLAAAQKDAELNKADAERYRWLHRFDVFTQRMTRYEWLLRQDAEYTEIGRDGVEAAIDAAMKGEK